MHDSTQPSWRAGSLVERMWPRSLKVPAAYFSGVPRDDEARFVCSSIDNISYAGKTIEKENKLIKYLSVIGQWIQTSC